ncbi:MULTISPECIES: malto-oligosyltrehalose trehalohydrolase [Kocuria]|uniref:malto-oligosyltrehalose trehalohydrolase n=1 Tax=Kocuria TaxID=57493 RepID=UPI0006D7B2C9|nr:MULTISPECIES: malto-oligosyltrehalose trehalohydrolase [Kocuria]MDN5631332.1 malto-oligosyltrehalose trehalohydrolase [Kocuria sp.]RUP84698.1 malto-oligosyltrehalose trehalohydrolase [Kocuria sp. HSID17590]RUQ09472.1 malto-oligosyltrehalose trehalohydrolase [Kocuria sp. HSID17582]
MSSDHRFDVWAPHARTVTVRIEGEDHPMVGLAQRPGWWTLPDDDAAPQGTVRYGYILGKVFDEGTPKEREQVSQVLPDPRSRRQPQGVHELSCTFDPDEFPWHDAEWRPRPLKDSVLYELHPGTFTPEGTLDSAIERLDHLVELGVTGVELLPVNGFNGDHNWGYDGVAWYTVDESYGGPAAYQRFVDACHAKGLSVIQDVVYNHLGPSGNYLPLFADYFKPGASSWGDLINLDGWGADGVREYILDNVTMWLREYHVDGFRLDAVHALADSSAKHILEEIAERVAEEAQRTGKDLVTIAESDLNDPRMIAATHRHGLGMDAQWLDDVHHAAHTAFTGETQGYYGDFASLHALEKTMHTAYFHNGTYSTFRGRSHGREIDPVEQRPYQFVTFLQNHDQVGNRAAGDRMNQSMSVDRAIAAATWLLAQPFTPMLFMGEEYGASTPWQFFTAHPEPELGEAVAKGRKAEFAQMAWDHDTVPDPQDPATFQRSKLNWDEVHSGDHERILKAYRDLIALRRETPELTDQNWETVATQASDSEQWFVLKRMSEPESVHGVVVAINLSDEPRNLPLMGGDEPQLLFASGAQPEPGTDGTVRLAPETAAVLRV